MTGFVSKRQAAQGKLNDDTQVYAGRKRGSIALARSLCYQINGAADDSDDMDGGGYGSVDIAEILSAEVLRLQKALAQPEQEPKCGAIIEVFGKDWRLEYMSLPVGKHKLYTQQYTYTTPPQRTWVGLTEWEREAIAHACGAMGAEWLVFIEAVEKALKEKNR